MTVLPTPLPTALCPICKLADSQKTYRPFCSKKCADIDLGRWFNGTYTVPTEEAAEGFDEGSPSDTDFPLDTEDTLQ